MTSEKKKYTTLEGIAQHPLFYQLTSRQQQWLLEYLKTGDRIAATHTAYPSTAKPTTTKHDYAEERATQNMAIANVRLLIAAYQGEPASATPMSKQELVAYISNRLRDAETSTAEFTKMTQYLIMLNRWHTKRINRDFATPVRDQRKVLEKDATAASTGEVENELVQYFEQALKGK